MAVYNGENFVARAIEGLLAQTYSDFELVISDNASQDRTEQICRAYAARDPRIVYHRQEKNFGAAPNHNFVFHATSGEYFMWHAHDDLCAPTLLERCVEVLDRDPAVVLCFARCQFIDDRGQVLQDYPYALRTSSKNRRERFLDAISADHINTEIAGMMRRSVLRQTPLIDSYVGSDCVLIAELALHGPFFQIPEPLFFHGEHEGRSTKKHRGLHERLVWFDTRLSGKIVLPTWRLLFEGWLSVWRALGWPNPLLTYDLLRVARWRHKRLSADLVNAAKQLLQTR